MTPLAFFDACGRLPDAGNTRFVPAGPYDNCSRTREAGFPNSVSEDGIAGIQRRGAELLEWARLVDAPVLSTTCLKMQRSRPELSITAALRAGADLPEGRGPAAWVAMDASDEEVEAALARRWILIERLSCSTGAENTRLRSFDPFGINRNTDRVVTGLGPRHWHVFGTGSEMCLISIVEGLRRHAERVTVVEDACVLAARTHSDSVSATLEKLESLGAELRPLEAVRADAGLARERAPP